MTTYTPIPMAAVGTVVFLGKHDGQTGSFDVRNCPNPEQLAAFIAKACNGYSVFLEFYLASKAVISTIGHPEATVDDERAAQERFEKAEVAARIAAKESTPVKAVAV